MATTTTETQSHPTNDATASPPAQTKYTQTHSDDELSRLHEQYVEQGWVVIPNVLSPNESEEALAALWAAARATEAQGTSLFMPRLDPNASNIRVFYLMELHALFRDLISHPTATNFVSKILGPQFLISNFTANIARPGSGSMGIHSDQSLQCPDPWEGTWALNCIWCLHDVHKENGATLYIPGSHQWKTREDVPEDAESKLVPFEAKRGDVLVMDGRLWHTSGFNTTKDQDRALLFGAYNAPWLRGQVNWAAGLSEETKKTLSLQQREWLGVDVTGNQGKVSGVNKVYIEKGVY